MDPYDFGSTPTGFFTAALAGNDNNVFDQSFGGEVQPAEDSDMNFEWNEPGPGPTLSQYPSPPPADGTFPDQQQHPQQYNPLIKNQAYFTNLPLDKSSRYSRMTLHKLTTQLASETVRVSNGQMTPVSKPVSPEQELDLLQENTKIPRSRPEALQRAKAPTDPEAAPVKKRTRRSRKRNPPSAEQEREKRDKLLERNRVAASKCRQKRKSYTTSLEEQARELQMRKDSLSLLANSLKDEVLFLKGQMLRHTDCTCSRVREYLISETDSLTCKMHPSAFGDDGSMLGHSSRQDSIVSTSSYTSGTHSGSENGGLKEPMKDLDALLRESLSQDTSEEGISRRLRQAGHG